MAVNDEWQTAATLGKGDKGKPFSWRSSEGGIEVLYDRGSRQRLTSAQIEQLLNHVGDRWFPLGASVTNPPADGLGRYLSETLKISPRYASQFAAVLVIQQRLRYRYEGTTIMLRAAT
ncbi:MAG: hypothetical protein ACYC6I_04755 [Bacillota bacterium]